MKTKMKSFTTFICLVICILPTTYTRSLNIHSDELEEKIKNDKSLADTQILAQACVNNNAGCVEWLSFCQSNSWVKTNCRLTCGVCVAPPTTTTAVPTTTTTAVPTTTTTAVPTTTTTAAPTTTTTVTINPACVHQDLNTNCPSYKSNCATNSWVATNCRRTCQC